MTNDKASWDCIIDGEEYKIIKKDNVWIKAKPLVNGVAYEHHICNPSNTSGSVTLHLDVVINQKPTGEKIYIPNCKIGTANVGDYINTSGAVDVKIFPQDACITTITPIVCSGSVCISGNTSGPVVYVVKY
ncbi:MAG: hypothetical protein NTW30_05695 [Candidatus Aenigmarchaeota archaeon]|nr:hypothetical protein [Candidatus Aenigmarchaeota archaeon]